LSKKSEFLKSQDLNGQLLEIARYATLSEF